MSRNVVPHPRLMFSWKLTHRDRWRAQPGLGVLGVSICVDAQPEVHSRTPERASASHVHRLPAVSDVIFPPSCCTSARTAPHFRDGRRH